VVVNNLTITCPAGVASVRLNLTLGSDNPFQMPLTVKKLHREEASAASGTRPDGLRRGPTTTPPPIEPALTLTKATVKGAGRYPPVMTPCSEQIVYNGIRTFSVDADSGRLTVLNGTAHGPAAAAAASSPPSHQLCFHLDASRELVVTVKCHESLSTWALREEDGHIRMGSAGRDASEDVCLSVVESNSTRVSCQPRSYYTDPSPEGACQSMQWRVLPVACAEATTWAHDRISGLISSRAPGAKGRCLTSVGPVESNNLAVSVVVMEQDEPGRRPVILGGDDLDLDPDPGASAGSPVSAFLDRQCGSSLTVAIGVATQRDVTERYGDMASESALLSVATALAGLGPLPKEHHAQRVRTKISYPKALLDLDPVDEPPPLHLPVESLAALFSKHASWWRRFYDRSWVDLGGGPADGGSGEWADLERFYFSMLYLMGSSMREGSVPPSLWGPFSTSDTPKVGSCGIVR
jgi:hypothetical protein